MKTVLIKANRLIHQPYPFYSIRERAPLLLLALMVFGFFFLYLFEPFVVYPAEHRMAYFWICLIHAALPTLIAFLYFGVLERVLVNNVTWTVGREFIHIGILLLLMGLGSFLVRDLIYSNPDNWSWGYLFEEIRNTLLSGFLILAIFVPVNYVHQLRKNIREAANIQPPPLRDRKETLSLVPVKTQVINDDFDLDPEKFILARADGNYMELYLENGSKTKKIVKRMSLKQLEEQLCPLPFILKTHRAYLVNLRKVQETKGNAQGYQLKLMGFEGGVPVSRSMVQSFKNGMEAL